MTSVLCTWGLVDYFVNRAENGKWCITRNMHASESPGDDSPETDGIVHECDSEKEATDWANDRAKDDIAFKRSVCAVVFVWGSEHAVVSQSK
jgi:hypothetical protein